MKKIICFLLAFTILFALCWCDNATTSGGNTSETVSEEDISNESQTESENAKSNYEEIEDANVQNQLLGFEFDYEYNVPGAYVPYQEVWSNEISDRYYYTYLTEYKEEISDYYLVYLSVEEITESKEWLSSYENSATNNGEYYYNYHFSNFAESRVIDGKYLYGYQNKAEKSDEIKYYQTNDIEAIEYEKDGYQLVLCAQSKKAVIKQNLTTADEVGKEIAVYRRVELKFEEDKNTAPSYYEFENTEKTNQTQIEEAFNYIGEMIECYPQSYESNDCGYFPILGFKGTGAVKTQRIEVVTKDGNKAVILPRYTGSDKTDLLDENAEIFEMDDIYGEDKVSFKGALIEDHENGKDAYFNYEKVVEIIKIIGVYEWLKIDDAYNTGWLNKEELKSIAFYFNNLFNTNSPKPNHDLIPHLTLSKYIEDNIKLTYLKHFGFDNGTVNDFHFFYYLGTYGNYVAVFTLDNINGYDFIFKDKTIDGVTFYDYYFFIGIYDLNSFKSL